MDDSDRDEPPVRVNVNRAVFKNLPQKQESARHGFSVRRHITAEDILRMGRGYDVERILSGFSEQLFVDVAGAMVNRLVNAGPHVVDLKVETYYDEMEQVQVVKASTPLLATKTYGPSVSTVELARSMAPREAATAVPVESGPPWWRRLATAIVEAGSTELSYEGPRGFIDT